MEEKFTKLNLNGVDKFVSAIYDGSGNEIVSTYETKTDSTNKLKAINESISTTNTNLSNLATRVTATENYKATIDSNTTIIQKNEAAIAALQTADTKFGEDLGALTIKVGEDETLIGANKKDIGILQSSTLELQRNVAVLLSLIDDTATGLKPINDRSNTNLANIAILSSEIEILKGTKTANESAILALQTLQKTNINNINKNISDIEAIRGDIRTHTGELGKLKEITDPLPAKVQSLGEAFDQINGDVQGMKSSLDNKISKELYEALLARVAVLEAAMAKYHPEEQPAE